ncbi:MAG: endopeptidase La [Burkholderiales bacterium]
MPQTKNVPALPGGRPVFVLPEDAIALIPVRNLVLFPGMILPLSVGREASVAAAQQAIRTERPVGILLQKDPEKEDPSSSELHHVGTVAQIVRLIATPDGTHHVICQGMQRFIVKEYLTGYPFMAARIERVNDGEEASQDIEARFIQLKKKAHEALELLPQAPPELATALQAYNAPGPLADMVAGFMDIKLEEKQQLLASFNIRARLDKVLDHLVKRIEVLRLTKEIDDKTKASLDKRQREFVLREQLKSIHQELGEGDGAAAEIQELEKALAEAKMPPEVETHARKELKRLARMPEASSEYSMARSYFDWLIELPWSKLSEGVIDLAAARTILDEDHFGLEKIKRRILEYLAVRKLNPDGHGAILCFAGPPGVGKTSLGQSIAKAMGRKFVRVSLGGVHDESEIRGHRRTYIGSLPGNIVQAIKKAGTRDCVMLLDEIDKLSRSGHGDPSSAMLEVLDPAQNVSFRDAYLGVPFDLSRVVFICTANMLDTIPGPLRDRMEIIHLPGYTAEEKLEIAQRYLVKRQLTENGLTAQRCTIAGAAIQRLISDYTREAGVRNLERELGALCRHAAVRVADGEAMVEIGAPQVEEILGPPKFESEVAARTSAPGVATGLAWTPVGGDILFIEASRTPGSGRLILTGQLGDVMKESAQAALTLVKSSAMELQIDTSGLDKSDIHVHIPAGAIPKDGPSAGVAMFLCLASLLSGRSVRHDTAMTGEISLRGLVLPVGGIKEKILAALRAGITRVMLPKRNEKDLNDVPKEARDKMEFIFLEHVDEAVRAALGKGARGRKASARRNTE